MSNNAHVNDDELEIHQLPEVSTLQAGMMVAVDSQPTGTKSFNLTTALEGKASAADMTALETTVSGKADASDVVALETAVSGKEDKVFIAEYNVTSYDEIDAAYKAGKSIICKYQPSPAGNPEQIYYLRSMQYIPYGSVTGGYMFGTCSGILGFEFIKCEKPNDVSTWTEYHNNALGGTVNLQNNGQFLSNDGTNTTWVDSPVPSVDTSTDIGKVLTVSANGNKSWENAIGFVKNVGSLTDAATITATTLNNGFATLSTSQSALTIIDVVGTDEVVNFAIEITPSVNCTLTIQKQIGSGTPVKLKHAVSAGNELDAGKTYQVTAVGTCWTLAEFES